MQLLLVYRETKLSYNTLVLAFMYPYSMNPPSSTMTMMMSLSRIFCALVSLG
jgi:hypothetical protein